MKNNPNLADKKFLTKVAVVWVILLLGSCLAFFVWPNQFARQNGSNHGDTISGLANVSRSDVMGRLPISKLEDLSDEELRERLLARDTLSVDTKRSRTKRFLRKNNYRNPVDLHARAEAQLLSTIRAFKGRSIPNNPRCVVTAAKIQLQKLEADRPR